MDACDRLGTRQGRRAVEKVKVERTEIDGELELS